ncbi:Adagio protein 1-like protein [Drosera capensis]
MQLFLGAELVRNIGPNQFFSEANIDMGPLPLPTIPRTIDRFRSSFTSAQPTLAAGRNFYHGSCGLFQLSDEVLSLMILSRLTPKDLAAVSSVCRHLCELTKNEDL